MTEVSVRNAKYHRLFMPLVPTYAYIDRADGKFAGCMDFKKDYAVIIAAAWEIDSAYDQFLTNPEADSHEVLRALHLDEVTNESERQEREHVLDMIASSKGGRLKERFVDPFGMWTRGG